MEEDGGYPPPKRRRFDWEAEQPEPTPPLLSSRSYLSQDSGSSSPYTPGYSVLPENSIQPGPSCSRQELVPPDLQSLLNPVDHVLPDAENLPNGEQDEIVCFGVVGSIRL